MAQMESALKEEAPEIAEAIQSENPAPPTCSMDQIQVGDYVRIPKWKTTGVILEKVPPQKAKVAMGAVTMILTVSEIYPLDAETVRKLKTKNQKR